MASFEFASSLESLPLIPATTHASPMDWPAYLAALVLSLLSAFFLAWIYSKFYALRFNGSNIHRALPLISLATTSIFVCVQFSLPLSLGLLGALAIVRFRTIIREPEEIGFIMLAVASSLFCATFQLIFLLVLLVVTLLALMFLNRSTVALSQSGNAGTLVIRCSTNQAVQPPSPSVIQLQTLLAAHLEKPILNSLVEHEGNQVITWSFQNLEQSALAELHSQIQQQLPAANIGIYFSNASGI